MWEDVGRWKRPRYYPRAGEGMQEAVNRECLAARGRRGHPRRFDPRQDRHPGPRRRRVPGPDLHRRLPPPRHRPQPLRTHAPRGRHDLRRRRDRAHRRAPLPGAHDDRQRRSGVRLAGALAGRRSWPDLDVYCTSVTDHWGDRRAGGTEVARRCCAGYATTSTWPAMRSVSWMCGRGHVAGVPARVFRISFSGELSFEVNVPAHPRARGLGCPDRCRRGIRHHPVRHGRPCTSCAPEKGFIIVGQDTDASMTTGRHGHGLGGAAGTSRSASWATARCPLADHLREDRLQLVGLASGDSVLPEGAALVDPGTRRSADTEPGVRELQLLQCAVSPVPLPSPWVRGG